MSEHIKNKEDDAVLRRFTEYIEKNIREAAAEYAEAHGYDPAEVSNAANKEPTEEEVEAFMKKAKEVLDNMDKS